MNRDEVERYLQADGWPCQTLDDSTFISGFSAQDLERDQEREQDRFRLFVRVTEDWLCLTIVPFVTAPRSTLQRTHSVGAYWSSTTSSRWRNSRSTNGTLF